MNIKEAEIATINAAIADKTDIYSVTTADVADRFKEIVALLGAILVNPTLTYNIGLIAYTASPFEVYVCKVDGATGVVTNQTNWLKMAGSGLPYLVADTEVYDTNVAKQDSNYYVDLNIDMNTQSGVLFALRFVNKDGSQTTQLGYNVLVDAVSALEGTSIILQTDNNGIGYSKLQITTSAGVYNEKLAISSTYLLTKTTDVNDIDGYILTKLASTGGRLLTVTGSTLSTGKYFVPNDCTVQLPLAVKMEGETVTLILTASGSITVNTSGSDGINNIGGLSYNLPKMTFTSNGIDKWYYTA